MKKPGYIIAVIAGILIATAFFVFDNNKFTVSGIKWGYKKGRFNVSFLITNDERNELGIDDIQGKRGIFPHTRFWNNMLPSDAQPVQIRLDFP